jgi:hypothetical protein
MLKFRLQVRPIIYGGVVWNTSTIHWRGQRCCILLAVLGGLGHKGRCGRLDGQVGETRSRQHLYMWRLYLKSGTGGEHSELRLAMFPRKLTELYGWLKRRHSGQCVFANLSSGTKARKRYRLKNILKPRVSLGAKCDQRVASIASVYQSNAL